MKYAIALALFGVTSVSASPYFVGENLRPKNHVSLGFADTPTKKNPATTNKTGNIMALEIDAAYNLNPNVPLRANLPFFFANEDAAGTSRNALGNVNIGTGWNMSFTSEDQAWTYGYAANLDLYVPTSRKAEGNTVWSMNPTTDLFKYYTKATSAVPTLGLFAERDAFSLKANIGVGYSYISGSGTSDRNRMNFPAQLGASWHAMPNLHINAEYNALVLDTETTAGGRRFRHGISPSLSGNYEQLIASAYATIPVDDTTRDATAVSFGINAGYTF